MKNGQLTPKEMAACNEFRRLLENSKATQAEVAHAIGVSQDMVSKMSTGKRAITVDSAINIAKFFKIPVHQIDPEIQAKINSAYHSFDGGDLAGVIDLLRSIDRADIGLALDLLRTVVKRKIKDIEPKD